MQKNKTMKTEEQIKDIISLQFATQGIHEISINNLKLLPLFIYPHVKECELFFSENCITVTLVKKTGFKSFFSNFYYDKQNDFYEKRLQECFYFWLQGIIKKPSIVVKWKKA